jgi:hypothetical protein
LFVFKKTMKILKSIAVCITGVFGVFISFAVINFYLK